MVHDACNLILAYNLPTLMTADLKLSFLFIHAYNLVFAYTLVLSYTLVLA